MDVNWFAEEYNYKVVTVVCVHLSNIKWQHCVHETMMPEWQAVDKKYISDPACE